MSGWTQKRFWQIATVVEATEGYSIELDGKMLKTPAKSNFTVPTMALAKAVSEEWQAQNKDVRPDLMPLTRKVNSALDKVQPAHLAVATQIAEYGGTDLICYRAEAPQALIDRQAAAWDPLLAWAENQLQAPLVVSHSLMPVEQPSDSLRSLQLRVEVLSAFELAALHDLVALSGSLVIGLAATQDLAPIDTLWELSRIDECWQSDKWGEDEGAAADATTKRAAFLSAKLFFDFCQ